VRDAESDEEAENDDEADNEEEAGTVRMLKQWKATLEAWKHRVRERQV
jgi:hypothetical protein